MELKNASIVGHIVQVIGNVFGHPHLKDGTIIKAPIISMQRLDDGRHRVRTPFWEFTVTWAPEEDGVANENLSWC